MQDPEGTEAPGAGSDWKRLLQTVDRLLRGEYTRPDRLRAGELDLPIKSLVVVCVLLGLFYGVMMGLFALLGRGGADGFLQVMASAIKVPLLFLLTLAFTFPSLYVFSALERSRLGVADTLRLLLAGLGVNLAVLASLGPIAAFFTLSTDSYPFMVLLHVVFFGVSGILGVLFVRQGLTAIFQAPAAGDAERPAADELPEPTEPSDADEPSAEGESPEADGQNAEGRHVARSSALESFLQSERSGRSKARPTQEPP